MWDILHSLLRGIGGIEREVKGELKIELKKDEELKRDFKRAGLREGLQERLFKELKDQGGISRRTSRKNSTLRVLQEVHLQGQFKAKREAFI